MYRYGQLIQTKTVLKGSSVVIGSCRSPYSDDTFYGWSTSNTSTTVSYTSTTSYTINSTLKVYAVFSYTTNKLVTQRYSAESSNSAIVSTTATAKINHNVTFKSAYSSVSGSGTPSFSEYNYGTSFVAISINEVIKASSSPVTYDLHTGDVITIYAAGYSSKAGYKAWFDLPYYTQATAYRVSSHP